MSARDKWYTESLSPGGDFAEVSLNQAMSKAQAELGTKVKARELITRAQRQGEASTLSTRFICRRPGTHYVVLTEVRGVELLHTGRPGLLFVTTCRDRAREYPGPSEAQAITDRLNAQTARHTYTFQWREETRS